MRSMSYTLVIHPLLVEVGQGARQKNGILSGIFPAKSLTPLPWLLVELMHFFYTGIYMLLKQGNSDVENGIQNLKMSSEKIIQRKLETRKETQMKLKRLCFIIMSTRSDLCALRKVLNLVIPINRVVCYNFGHPDLTSSFFCSCYENNKVPFEI